jgi:two-component system response regulator AtoC
MGFFKKEPKILVVDDDRNLTDNLVEYLTKLDYQAFPAYGGREGLTKFEQDDFQVVITDLKMPEMDGMELLEKMKQLDNDVIVIILTGYGTIESSVAAVKKGAYDYISKPVEFKEIELIVNRALDKHAIFSRMQMFRWMFYLLLLSIPLWILSGMLLISAWK